MNSTKSTKIGIDFNEYWWNYSILLQILSPFSFINGEDFSPFSFINGEDFSPLSLFYLLATHRPAGIAQICDFDRNITDLSDWVWSILGILICNDTGIIRD